MEKKRPSEDDDQLILELREDEKEARPARALEEKAPVDVEEIGTEESEIL